MRTIATSLVALGLIGCGEPAAVSHEFTVALTQTAIRNYDEPGVRGMDLDDRVSDSTDAATCGQQDAVDPIDGEIGVDNALGGGVDRTLISERPRPFDLPVLFDLELRTSGALVDAQHVTVILGGVQLGEAEVVNGRFQAIAEPATTWTVEIPLDEEHAIPLSLHGPAIEGRITETGELVELLVGGRIDLDEQVHSVTESADIDPDLVRRSFEAVADLDPDEEGKCQSASIALLAEVTG